MTSFFDMLDMYPNYIYKYHDYYHEPYDNSDINIENLYIFHIHENEIQVDIYTKEHYPDKESSDYEFTDNCSLLQFKEIYPQIYDELGFEQKFNMHSELITHMNS